MSDDKRPDWKKGLDIVKVFYSDSKINARKVNFFDMADHGKDTLIQNSKQTWIELQKIFGRMTLNHQSALIGIRTYVKHKVYIYPTLKKRIMLLSGMTAYLLIRTRFYKFNVLPRAFGFYCLTNILIPDYDIHSRRLSIEMDQNLKWITKFFGQP